MNGLSIKLMRGIDYWIGIPLCFLFTILFKIERFFGVRKLKSSPKNILFIELVEMGSSVVSYPSLIEAKKLFPKANIYFLVFDNIKESVYLFDKIIPKKNIWTIKSNSVLHLFFDTIKFIYKARKNQIDVVVDMEFFSRYSAMLTFLSGAKMSSGFHKYNIEGMYRGELFTHKVAFNPYVHTAHAYLSLVHALKQPENQIPMLKMNIETIPIVLPKKISTKKEKEDIYKKLKSQNNNLKKTSRIVIINPNSSFLIPLRRWPLTSYVLLIKKLIKKHNDIFVVITGVSSESSNAQFIKRYVDDDRVIDFTGKTSVDDLIHLYNISESIITNDSGPAQLAALTNIRIYVFFGPETPIRFKPLSENVHIFFLNYYCSPCISPFNQLLSACKDNKCITTISVENVFEKIDEQL